jgi:hypothetical protein
MLHLLVRLSFFRAIFFLSPIPAHFATPDMLPALPRLSRGKNRIWLIGVQILAAIIGFVILLVIAITEPEDSC